MKKSGPVAFQQRFQVVTGVRLRHFGNLLRSAHCDDLATLRTTFWPQVYQPVGSLDHIKVVLDHHHGIAVVPQAVQYVQQLLDIREVQASGRLIEDIQGFAGITLGQLARQLDPLRLATRQRGR